MNKKDLKKELVIGRIYQSESDRNGPIYWLKYRGFRSSPLYNMIVDENGAFEAISTYPEAQGQFSITFGTYVFVTQTGKIVEFDSLDDIRARDDLKEN